MKNWILIGSLFLPGVLQAQAQSQSQTPAPTQTPAPAAMPAHTPAANAALTKEEKDLKNLKNRVQGYVETMMKGDRAAMLARKDYYTTIFITDQAKVSDLKKLANGEYEATVEFETHKRIHQDPEFTPLKKSEVKSKEKIVQKVNFQIHEGFLHWTSPLESPFVQPGKEKRYVLESPQPEKKKTKK